MKIALLQIDGKMPNLALMKIAAFHRKRGDEVTFIDLSSIKADRWYGSKIFMGGSGYDLKAKLPSGIEEQVPDYDLFNIDYSIGFTTRGCIRNCDFCIVKEKEGNLLECDFSRDIKHSRYIIMDNNFLASEFWKEKLKYFIDNKIKVCFNQGLDIRLITEEKAKVLSKVLYYDASFTHRRLYFAFDNPKLEKVFKEKLEILIRHVKPYRIMVYVLVGHDTTFDQDMKRFEIIRSFGCDPYIMIYNNRRDNQELRDFSRWVNKRVYKSCSWKDYKGRKT